VVKHVCKFHHWYQFDSTIICHTADSWTWWGDLSASMTLKSMPAGALTLDRASQAGKVTFASRADVFIWVIDKKKIQKNKINQEPLQLLYVLAIYQHPNVNLSLKNKFWCLTVMKIHIYSDKSRSQRFDHMRWVWSVLVVCIMSELWMMIIDLHMIANLN
jgi:hypothetical protein